MTEFPKFPTIRQEAKYGNTTSEYHLRLMLSQGQLPGFYSGRTFHVNHEQLVQKLNSISQANGGEAARECVNSEPV